VRHKYIDELPEALHGTAEAEWLSYLEIIELEDRKPITVIELLGPTIKTAGPNRDQYLAHRCRIFLSSIDLVEIDLSRSGLPLVAQNAPTCAYCVILSRATDRPKILLWPIQLRDRLPAIRIPLPSPHADAVVDLQQLFHETFDAAGYEDYIYNNAPQPQLSPDDADWARQLISTRR
jgi:hypothetical protein